MKFVKKLNLLGVEAAQIPSITGDGAPTESTEGAVGCLYMDKATGNMYKCTSAVDGVCVWKPIIDKDNILNYITYEVTGDNTVTITNCFKEIEGAFVIPDTIENCVVTRIGDSAFDGCSSLTGIILPYGLTTIGPYAFSNCVSLAEIVIPDTVERIESYAFAGCNFSQVTLPNNLQLIGNNAFHSCNSLIKITIPLNVNTIENNAFDGCTELRSIQLKCSVSEICESVFSNCTSLREISIGLSVGNIHKNAFNGCESLTDIYYDGSEDQWASISISEEEGNDVLETATIHYNQCVANKKYVDDKVSDISVISTTPEQESVQLGEPLTLTLDSSKGWTDNGDGSYTHTKGATDALVFSLNEDPETNLYQVSFEGEGVTNNQNHLNVTIGASKTFDLYGMEPAGKPSVGIQAVPFADDTLTQTLKFTPKAEYTGTISKIVVQKIIGIAEQNERLTVKDSDGNVSLGTRIISAYDGAGAFVGNIFVGNASGEKNVNGWGNYSFGHYALSNNTSGFRNTAIGHNALRFNTVGSRNTAIGYIALQNNICGLRNTAIGGFALSKNINGYRNVAIGEDCLQSNLEGACNIGIGATVLYQCKRGYGNVGVGDNALYKVSTGCQNIGIGSSAQSGITTGMYNVGIGEYALSSNSTGSCNVSIGVRTGTDATTNAWGNIYIGAYVCSKYSSKDKPTSYTGSFNILIGHEINLDNPTDNHKLNIGNLIKGSMADDNKYVELLGSLLLNNIPTTDPQTAGSVWNDNGILKISAGAA